MPEPPLETKSFSGYAKRDRRVPDILKQRAKDGLERVRRADQQREAREVKRRLAMLGIGNRNP